MNQIWLLFLVQGISLGMDLTKRLRLVKNSTMVDVKVIVIILCICYLIKHYIKALSLIDYRLNYLGNFNSFMSMSECENSCKDGGSSRAMCLLPRWEQNEKKVSMIFAGLRDLARIGFQSGILTTLKNAACLSTMGDVKVKEDHWLKAWSHILLQGNGNKYDSEEECQKACPKEFLQADICQLPKETGPCFDLVERYYFDFQMGTCQRFEFGGCEGNHWILCPSISLNMFLVST